MFDLGDELLDVFAGLCIFGLERQINILEKFAKHIKLVLHGADHEMAESALLFHLVTYSNKRVIKLDKEHKLIQISYPT